MIVGHNPTLVILSASIAMLGCFTAFVLLTNFRFFGPREARARLSMAWVTLSVAIAATNLAGVLAIELGLNLMQHGELFGAAAASAIVGVGLGLYFGSLRKGAVGPRFLLGVAFLGAGITATQYLGLLAVAGLHIEVSWFLAGVCAAISMQIAGMLLWLLFRPRGVAVTVFGSILIGLAISTNHYLAVASLPKLDLALLIAPRADNIFSVQHLAWGSAALVYLICGLMLSISIVVQFKGDVAKR